MSSSFEERFRKYFTDFLPLISTDKGEWTIKGFIDVYKNIYTISLDTKIVSKIIELMIFPKIFEFAQSQNYKIVLSEFQNHYPDISFIDCETDEKIALDIKSTYRINNDRVNGMTLGAFSGYFRNRDSTKNITFPYNEYSKHYVLGIIYSRADIINAQNNLDNYGIKLNSGQKTKLVKYLSNRDAQAFEEFISSLSITEPEKIEEIGELLSNCLIYEGKKYNIENFIDILSVVRDFQFFLQEKWKIASDKPGSGNTKNIGSTKILSELVEGRGKFTKFKGNGEAIFNDYWIYYMNEDMRRFAELDKAPYSNLDNYKIYKGMM